MEVDDILQVFSLCSFPIARPRSLIKTRKLEGELSRLADKQFVDAARFETGEGKRPRRGTPDVPLGKQSRGGDPAHFGGP